MCRYVCARKTWVSNKQPSFDNDRMGWSTVLAMAERRVGQELGKPKIRYPWSKWADGEVWLLKGGEDFDILPISMQGMAYSYAKTHGLKVRTEAHPEGVLVQFEKPKLKLAPGLRKYAK